MLRALAANSGVIQVTTFTEYVKFPEPNPARDSAIVAIKAKYPRFDEMNKIQMSQYQAERSQLNEIYPPRLATVSDFVDHIDHVVQVAGINYVGIGTDFDGGGELDGLEDVSQMPNITRELVRRGYTKEEIRKIWGGNFMRVLRTAALTAQSAE
jgi:membrane dipeptidase